jgi:hypothetical protein
MRTVEATPCWFVRHDSHQQLTSEWLVDSPARMGPKQWESRLKNGIAISLDQLWVCTVAQHVEHSLEQSKYSSVSTSDGRKASKSRMYRAYTVPS